MSFFLNRCKTQSDSVKFGIYDPPPISSGHAFIVEDNEYEWIAVVENHYREIMVFFAIDNCLPFPLREDGTMANRCDGVLMCTDKIAFVELKSRDYNGGEWVKHAAKQLLSAIENFQRSQEDNFEIRRAYICNNQRPRARRGQAERIERFSIDSKGYALFIKARINLNDPEG
jgi:hypothetical protein